MNNLFTKISLERSKNYLMCNAVPCHSRIIIALNFTVKFHISKFYAGLRESIKV